MYNQPDLFSPAGPAPDPAEFFLDGCNFFDLDKLYELSIQAYSAVANARMDDTLDKTCLHKYIKKILDTVSDFEAKTAASSYHNKNYCKNTAEAQLRLRAAADRAANDRGDPLVRTVLDSAYRVGHEIHRLMGLLRFTLVLDGFWLARCAPDHSILPVFAEYFTLRFGDDPWAIIDEKRRLALVRTACEEPCLGPLASFPFLSALPGGRCPDDKWEELWRRYHRNVSIENRKNPRLQLQLMPRRYWKYLPEIK
ncbi:MAG: TIGR03915 family putative DNA repair protein [Treponema sp.]|nr:TIGR03915 family putative DNA repair protein [Treponema sp.]